MSRCAFIIDFNLAFRLFGDFNSLELLEQFVLPFSDTLIFNLSHVDLKREIYIKLFSFLVFLRSINHLFVDIENPTSIDKKRIEPAMKRRFFPIVELNPHIVIHQ